MKLLTKPAFAIVKKGIETVIPDALTTRRFTGLVDLLDQALKVEEYTTVLTRIFGSDLDISQREITEARAYRKLLLARYEIAPYSPG